MYNVPEILDVHGLLQSDLCVRLRTRGPKRHDNTFPCTNNQETKQSRKVASMLSASWCETRLVIGASYAEAVITALETENKQCSSLDTLPSGSPIALVTFRLTDRWLSARVVRPLLFLPAQIESSFIE